MVSNTKELKAVPVFGFEWGGCYSEDEKEGSYRGRNVLKGMSFIPILNFVSGVVFIGQGITLLSETDEKAEQNYGVDHRNLKGAAWIARGVITLVGGGILFALADAVTTAGRAFFRPEKKAEE